MFLVGALLVILTWQFVLDRYIGFTYTDEIITLLLGGYFLYSILWKKYLLSKRETQMLMCMLMFYVAGSLSAVANNYQNNIIFGFISGMFSLKMFVAYFGARSFFHYKNIDRNFLRKMLFCYESMLMITALLLLADRFAPLFGRQYGTRYGIRSSAFVFTHPTELACYSVCLLMLSIYIRNILHYKKQYYKNYIPAIYVVVISGRTKAIAFMVLFLLMRLIVRFIKRFRFSYILLGVPAILFVAHEQLVFYFTDLSTARGALYYYSYFIAKDHFPLGAGFATYGTEFSRRIYSPIYHQYGMDRIYGLSPDAPNFVADTMWPAILGEAGFVGAVTIFLLFVFLFMFVREKIKDKNCALIITCLILYILIESIADSIFMSSRGCTIAVILAFMITYYPKEAFKSIYAQAKV